MRKTNGITLIALIITIIIMIILVAVTISVMINSGLIGKAKNAGKATSAAYDEERNLGENIVIDGKHYNSIDEYVDADPNQHTKIKNAIVTSYGTYSDNSFSLLKENGDLYFISTNPSETGYVQFNEENAILVAQNVKEIYARNYYKTNDNSLYFFTINDSEATPSLVGENVTDFYEDVLVRRASSQGQGFYGKAYFKDSSDSLYKYDSSNNTTTKLGDNVSDFAFASYINSGSTICYLTNDKKLYAVSGNTLISENVEKLFWFDRNNNLTYDCYYITSDNNIYYVRYTGPTGSVTWNGALKR